MSMLFHFFKEFIYNLKQHRLLSLGAVLTSSFIWVILGFFVIIYFNLFLLYSSLKEDAKIVIYLQDNLNPADIKGLEERLSSEREVLSVNYVPKEKALMDFKRTLQSRDDLFKNFEGNPLPGFFEVKLKDSYQSSADFAVFAEKFKGNKGVEDIFYGKEWIDGLNRYIEFIQLMEIAVGAVLLVGVITTTGIIVRLTVYSKREEIQVLKYIGATDGFIKMPLLIEGAFLGMMSAALSLVILYGVFQFIEGYGPFRDLFIGAPFKTTFLPLDFIIIFLISGPFLGAIGSFFPLRKYIKSFN